MGEEVQEWQHLWGAKVQLPIDVPDDLLKDGIQTVQAALEKYPDFEADGMAIVEDVKTQFDERWGPSWHCVLGKAFGAFVTHETQNFMYFYCGDKAVMLFKAG